MKYYKPNHSTLLYLNTEYNCIKSNSITITRVLGGSGYTSAPTINIIPEEGDIGSGASATCTITSGVINATITMNSNGSGYNKLPKIQLVGGNPTTPAVLTASFTRTFDYTWSVPDITINDLGKLAVVNCVGSESVSSSPYIFRIKNIQYDSRNTYMSDYGDPIISMARFNGALSSVNSSGTTEYHLILSPQVIKEIKISLDDNIFKNVGVPATIQFILGIEIEEIDVEMTRIDNPYEEGASKLKLY